MISFCEFDILPQDISLEIATQEVFKLIDFKLKNSTVTFASMMEHLSKSKGKGIRTALLLSAASDSNKLVSKDAILASAAIELLHMATLVHDDVIDDAPLRRGNETVQSKFGKKTAVICGDYLICIALSTITPLFEKYSQNENFKLLDVFSKSLENICVGEFKQHVNNKNCDLTTYEYLKTIYGKTAALFAISGFTGAVIFGHDKQQCAQIKTLSTYIGMIFQIMDDCKDFEFSAQQALKPVKHDVLEGVVTLPLICAIANQPNIKLAAKEVFSSGVGVSQLVASVCAAKGTEDAKKLAQKYAQKARKIIDNINHETQQVLFRNILSQSLGEL